MMGLRRRTLVIFAVLALGLLVGGGLIVQAQTSAGPETRTLQATTDVCSSSFCIDWSVLAGGLGPMESDSFRLESTLGQTMAGLFSGDTYQIEAGYWAGVNRGGRVFIPVVIKD